MSQTAMRTIGLLGGMSWVSTAEYYRLINTAVRERLGPLHSARIVLYSVDFAQIEELQRRGDWTTAAAILADGARRIEAAGAGCLLICANTMHIVAEEVSSAVSIPLIHVADAAAEAVRAAGFRTVGLLGTRFVMEQSFYRDRLERDHDLSVLVPKRDDRDTIHRVIFEELCAGHIEDHSRNEFLEIIAELIRRGAEGIILGCTEIGLLVKPEHLDAPLFDTAAIHSAAAVDWALANSI